MPKDDFIRYRGTIKEIMPNSLYRVELENGLKVIASVAGRARSIISKIFMGDRVIVEFSPYDLTRGKIIGVLGDKDESKGVN